MACSLAYLPAARFLRAKLESSTLVFLPLLAASLADRSGNNAGFPSLRSEFLAVISPPACQLAAHSLECSSASDP